MEQMLQVGIITSTHGIRGEVKVLPTTDDAARFKKCKSVLLELGNEYKELKIESVKLFKQFAILKFQGFDNINDIEKYKGGKLFVTRENAVKLNKDEYFIADLIDCTVVDEEEKEVGVLKDVMPTGANDVYIIEMRDGKELLLPAIKECILSIDVEAAKIKVHIMDGLLE